ncbi:hypothetical protein [Dysgonomonas sp. GY617]|uniref:hypothetical protein n=1 Tax=Dysgonomonas sp. GY617 TaxID=2780420 RepID=UPI00188388FC|nr:hypothetical protein [Dysgonomonas sp. GY617]MBF0575509.1 hypothetical protein [Dysgonomonas sp. GY617]
MYKRFLNDSDYLGVISSDALAQLTRGYTDRYIQAEESAEMSIVEYLSENYQIEQELNKGKYIAGYDRAITYPVGVHVYYEEKIYEVIRSISGFKAPYDVEYWEELININIEPESKPIYSQFGTYYKDDIVFYNGVLYICREENGYKFANIRIPMVNGWFEVVYSEWQPIEYNLWDVVRFENGFYTLLSLDGFDNNLNPLESDNWGAVADYDSLYNEYELSEHEYVVYKDKVYYPEIDINADIPEVSINLSLHDNRSYNLKKHMVRLAIYELTKLIAPNNVSVVRMRDYEDSMKWLSDAAKLKLNPQIPRKLAEDNKPVTDWQLATFQTDYDPNKNPWLT